MIALLALFTATPAQAQSCGPAVTARTIGLTEQPDGVPNLAQSGFPGDNDCGPTAGSMLLGYWDTNGWSCMAPNGSPYSTIRWFNDGSGKGEYVMSQGSKANMFDLQQELPYTETSGTWYTEMLFGFDSTIGEDIRAVATKRDPGAADWWVSDDAWVSGSDITNAVDSGNPSMMLFLHGDPYTTPRWEDGTAENDIWVSYHWMTMIGYETKDWIGGTCGALAPDEFFIGFRSGWEGGGDGSLWYHQYGTDHTDMYLVRVEPRSATPQCGDVLDMDGDGFYGDNLGTGWGGPVSGPVDCNDMDAGIFPGAFDACDGIDNDCDGQVDGLIDSSDTDSDGDGVRDECDLDDDGDGAPDATDVCPGLYDPDQDDQDGDGMGDLCDLCPYDADNDWDQDAICDDEDNCSLWNPDQADYDGDGIGDVCDLDVDGDGVADLEDLCPEVEDDGVDTDGDGVGDACDACPDDYDPEQEDPDGDGLTNGCDDDDDGDFILDVDDNCPLEPNFDQIDYDRDGIGYACDTQEKWDVFKAEVDGLRKAMEKLQIRDPLPTPVPRGPCASLCPDWLGPLWGQAKANGMTEWAHLRGTARRPILIDDGPVLDKNDVVLLIGRDTPLTPAERDKMAWDYGIYLTK